MSLQPQAQYVVPAEIFHYSLLAWLISTYRREQVPSLSELNLERRLT